MKTIIKFLAIALVFFISSCSKNSNGEPAPQPLIDKYKVTTLAGTPMVSGDTEGATAKFNNPNALVVDADGTVYITDSFNH